MRILCRTLKLLRENEFLNNVKMLTGVIFWNSASRRVIAMLILILKNKVLNKLVKILIFFLFLINGQGFPLVFP